MKVSKIALRTARQLLNATVVNGAIDSERAKAFVKKVGEKKPRGYLQVLTAYENLVRLELDKRHRTRGRSPVERDGGSPKKIRQRSDL